MNSEIINRVVIAALIPFSGTIIRFFRQFKRHYENKFGPGWLDDYKKAWH